MPTYADVCWRMLLNVTGARAEALSRINKELQAQLDMTRGHADRLERQLAALQPQAAAHELASGMLTYAGVC